MSARKQVAVHLRCKSNGCTGPHVLDARHYQVRIPVGNWTPKELIRFKQEEAASARYSLRSQTAPSVSPSSSNKNDFWEQLHEEKIERIRAESKAATEKHLRELAKIEAKASKNGTGELVWFFVFALSALIVTLLFGN